jgi:hypothetical protein
MISLADGSVRVVGCQGLLQSPDGLIRVVNGFAETHITLSGGAMVHLTFTLVPQQSRPSSRSVARWASEASPSSVPTCCGAAPCAARPNSCSGGSPTVARGRPASTWAERKRPPVSADP